MRANQKTLSLWLFPLMVVIGALALLLTTQTSSAQSHQIHVSDSILVVDEGRSFNAYAVKLTADPGQAVTVTITNPEPATLQVSETTLNFDSSNWSNPRSVIVKAPYETRYDASDERIDLTHELSTGGQPGPTVTVYVRDPLAQSGERLIIGQSQHRYVSLDEDGSGFTYSVRLSSPPQDKMVVAPRPSLSKSVSIEPDALIFTRDTWTYPQFITVKAIRDLDSTDDRVTVTHRSGLFSGPRWEDAAELVDGPEIYVRTTDTWSAALYAGSDGKAVTSLVFNEGSQRTYELRLADDPGADMTFNLEHSPRLSVTPDQVAFTHGSSGNWAAPQMVTVRADRAPHTSDDALDIKHVVDGTNALTLPVTVRDISAKKIILYVPEARLSAPEGGASFEYLVALVDDPGKAVTMRLTSSHPDALQVSPATLTFDSSNFTTARAVTVSAPEDNNGDSETATISHAVEGYRTGEINVTAEDNDPGGLIISPRRVSVKDDAPVCWTYVPELGSDPVQCGYGIRLARDPGAGKTVTVKLVNKPEGVFITSAQPIQFTGGPNGNWDEIRWFKVTANPSRTQDDATYTVVHQATISGFSSTGSVKIRVTRKTPAPTAPNPKEADEVIIVKEPQTSPDGQPLPSCATGQVPLPTILPRVLHIVEGGESRRYGIFMGRDPGADLSVQLHSAPLSNPTSLKHMATVTFTSGDNGSWSNIRWIVMSQPDDDNALGGTLVIRHGVSCAGNNDEADYVLVHFYDDDQAEVVISDTTLEITEGASGTYTVELATKPSGEVTVAVSDSSNEVTLSPSSLTFDPDTWNTPQTVTVAAPEDTDQSDEEVVLSHQVTGYTGASTPPEVTVQIADNDAMNPRIVFDQAQLSVVEGGASQSYTVALTNDPGGNVTVGISSSDDGALSVTPTSLPFTGGSGGNWATPQTVQVTPVNDDDGNDESVQLTHEISGSTIPSAGLTVTVTDDETPGLVASVSSLDLIEGGEVGAFTINLATDPGEGATVTARVLEPEHVTLSALAFDKTQTGYFEVTFSGGSNGDWDVAKVVEVTPKEEETFKLTPDVKPDSVALDFEAEGYPGVDEDSTALSVDLTIADNDLPEISITAGSDIVGGANAEFTLTSNAPLTAALTVSVTITASGNYGVTTGKQAVAVPASGSAGLIVITTGGGTNEADGSVTVTVDAGDDYTVSSTRGAATVAVSDDDDATPSDQPNDDAAATACVTTDSALLAQVEAKVAEHRSGGRTDLREMFTRARDTMLGSDDYTTADIRARTDKQGAEWQANGPNALWQSIYAELDRLEACRSGQQAQPLPVVAMLPQPDVSEGEPAKYLLTMKPIPAQDVVVKLTVSQTGDFVDASNVGAHSVTMGPGSGTAVLGSLLRVFSVPTNDDTAVEADGSVTVILNAGAGYTVGANASDTVAVSDDDGPPPTPEVRVTAGNGVTEGGSAEFTVTASPPPGADLTVSVTVSATGDYGVTTGTQTVTIPTTGSATLTVGTSNDAVDEADGSVTATLNAGTGYTVSTSQGAATVAVADDDDPPADQPDDDAAATACVTADQALLAQVEAKTQDPWNGGRPDLLEMFTRSYDTMQGSDDYTTADIRARPDKQAAEWQGNGPNALWQSIYAELDRLEACRGSSGDEDDDPPPTPEVSIAAGQDVSEGGTASFTLTASPSPSAALTVNVNVAASGDYGVTTGSQTVTIPTSGSVTFTVATIDDSVDEPVGSITVTALSGTGYDVSSSASSGTLLVNDDDDPPAQPLTPTPTPEVSVSGGAAVVEGGSAQFTVTASPAPGTALTVNVTVSATGDYGVTTGTQTVTIPTTGSATLTVATTDDSVDEADGSVTATLNAGNGYTVSSSQGTGTVAVSDDDVPEISITAGSGVTEGGTASFTLTASPVPAADLDVSVTVSASGDYGVTTGTQTITIPASGLATVTVATVDDSVDEVDGSVTVTVGSGTGYTVDASAGSGTVAIADDDDPPARDEEPEPPASDDAGGVTVSSITTEKQIVNLGGKDTIIEFTVTLSEPAPGDGVAVSFTGAASGWVANPNLDYSIEESESVADDKAYEYDGYLRGTLTIGPGEMQGTIRVKVNANAYIPGRSVILNVTIEQVSGEALGPSLLGTVVVRK